MNWAHLHLILNHFPILGAFLITGLIIFSLWKKDKEILNLTFFIMIFIGILALPAYFTGEPAEEFVEHLPGVSEQLITRHESAALYGLILTQILAAFGIVGVILQRRNWERAQRLLKPLLFLGVIDMIVMARIGNLGGEIRHSEIRDTNITTQQNTNHSKTSSEHPKKEAHDKD
jgi:uncharacterized membrane protein